MPSKRKLNNKPKRKISGRGRKRSKRSINHSAFLPLLVLSFIFWMVYRNVFRFPVFFDELIGKALFFGLPVWLYVLVSGFEDIHKTFASYKVKRGLMLGVAIGGLFGFVAVMLAFFRNPGVISPAIIFASDKFWGEFGLALLTGFWETLFFFGFVMLVLRDKFKNWSLLKQIMIVATVFMVFHLPNIILRFNGVDVMYQIFLLTFFAVGQALFFMSEENGYALTLSHAIWGMVLLIHF